MKPTIDRSRSGACSTELVISDLWTMSKVFSYISPTALKLNCFMCLFVLVVPLFIVSVADKQDWLLLRSYRNIGLVTILNFFCYIPNPRTHFHVCLTDGTGRENMYLSFYATAGIQTQDSLVALTHDLLKDALLTELPRRCLLKRIIRW